MNIDFSQMTTAQGRVAADLDAARVRAHAALFAAIEAVAEAVTGPVPLTEKLSWSAKEMAARAVAEGSATLSQQAMILGEATETGETVAGLADRVIRNADGYRAVIAALTGLRRTSEAHLRAAVTVAEVDAAMAEAAARLAAVPGG